MAFLLCELAVEDGLVLFLKTFGSKGMQLSVFILVDDWELSSWYALSLAKCLEQQRLDFVVLWMMKVLRLGKVLVDWSQNNLVKIMVVLYSLRVGEEFIVLMLLIWDEVVLGKHL